MAAGGLSFGSWIVCKATETRPSAADKNIFHFSTSFFYGDDHGCLLAYVKAFQFAQRQQKKSDKSEKSANESPPLACHHCLPLVRSSLL